MGEISSATASQSNKGKISDIPKYREARREKRVTDLNEITVLRGVDFWVRKCVKCARRRGLRRQPD